ncbi:MAG: response regulator [Aestuariivirga sp.]|uniref:response regulator n=1 Tax=Aestuariivirga sp. TaxID=2650926 RepID=UPI0038CF2CFC
MRAPVDDLPHILVVDDDRRIRNLLQAYLLDNGFRVSVAGSAAEARDKMRGVAFELVVLDIMMPGESGLSLTAALRNEGSRVPVLMLSALAETSDRIAGLETGSDDYLAKPFEPRELLLRIQALLRRRDQPERSRAEVAFGPFVFHVQRGELRKGGNVVRLTTRERDFLRRLAASAGQAVARAELAPDSSDEGGRAVDVQINRLRQKIEDDPSTPLYLQTVRGTGYVLLAD